MAYGAIDRGYPKLDMIQLRDSLKVVSALTDSLSNYIWRFHFYRGSVKKFKDAKSHVFHLLYLLVNQVSDLANPIRQIIERYEKEDGVHSENETPFFSQEEYDRVREAVCEELKKPKKTKEQPSAAVKPLLAQEQLADVLC